MDLEKKLFFDLKNTLIFILIVFGPLFIYLLYGEKSGLFEKQDKEEILNFDFKVVILRKYIDTNNYNEPTLKLSKGNIIGISEDSLKLKVGDSLIKNKGNHFLFIKRKNTVINKIDLFKNRIYLLN